ncbi:hypothetical protein T08_3861 [Trichinella sp. T8]|nr:hypothetical protein T08_3861 [Trichinella sp. T8]
MTTENLFLGSNLIVSKYLVYLVLCLGLEFAVFRPLL